MEVKSALIRSSPTTKTKLIKKPMESSTTRKKREEKKQSLDISKDSTCSSNSSSTSSSASTASGGSSGRNEAGFRRRRRVNGSRSVKVVSEPVKVGIDAASLLLLPGLLKRRCTWITPFSEQVYVSFHDEEWGVPVHDDRKLFELLIFSEALAELSWPTILSKRDIFRKLFENYDPSSVAKLTEKNIISLKSSGSSFLSEQKLRAIVENAKQILKITEEFGSFSNYCWSFINQRPIIHGFRYARQVPIKTSKAETMSKDLIHRGFLCVGPTVIYSFMQAAGLVNDHLCTCYRYGECIRLHCNTESQAKTKSPLAICKVMEEACSLKA